MDTDTKVLGSWPFVSLGRPSHETHISSSGSVVSAPSSRNQSKQIKLIKPHQETLVKEQCILDNWKYSFSQGTINEWNK